MLSLLLIDDEPDVRKSLSNFLEKLGHKVKSATNGLEGLREFHSGDFDLVITDIKMPGMDGIELLRRIKEIERSTVDVIVITGHGDMDNAIKALKYGAFDYLQKPINVRELAITLERIEQYRKLQENYATLKKNFQERVEQEVKEYRGSAERLRKAYLEELGLADLVVFSDPMRQVVELAEKYSLDRSIPVLIEGETGTGKELLARYIHYYGRAAIKEPFVAINCAAISGELFESELFGYEPGAFTGASPTGRMGKLEVASGGTIFLDEVAEIPLGFQAKLLRALEQKRFFKVGGTKEIPVDVRVISATNKDLRQEVKSGRFRQDLYYRINVGYIRIPPLRERRESIVPLAVHFAQQAFSKRGKKFEGFTSRAERFLCSLEWPGNVRQLKNAMERLAVLESWGFIDRENLSFLEEEDGAQSIDATRPVLGRDHFDLPEEGLDLEALNYQIIFKALERFKGNQTKTAKYLGISRRVLQGYLERARKRQGAGP